MVIQFIIIIFLSLGRFHQSQITFYALFTEHVIQALYKCYPLSIIWPKYPRNVTNKIYEKEKKLLCNCDRNSTVICQYYIPCLLSVTAATFGEFFLFVIGQKIHFPENYAKNTQKYLTKIPFDQITKKEVQFQKGNI